MKVVEISRKDLENNLKIIKKIANYNGEDDNGNRVKIIAVVKANALGLDLIKFSKFLVNNGIKYLAVSTVEEAIALRKAGIKEEIILLSPTNIKKELKLLIENGITLTISSNDDISVIKEIIKSTNQYEKHNSSARIKDATAEKKVQAHIKIDTGMGRYGFLYTEPEEILNAFRECSVIKIEGMYTHFSNSRNEKWTRKQFDRFLDVVAYIKKEKIEPGILHCSSSTAFLKYNLMHLNAVRIGSVFQGRTLVSVDGLVKIGSFKTNVVEIKTLPKGYNIGYNNTCKTKRKTKIAVIPVGYMDGLNKGKLRDCFTLKENILSVGIEIKKFFKDNSLKATINNNKYKIIGQIGTYHCVADITRSEDIEVGNDVYLDIPPMQVNENIAREYV